MFLSIIVQEGLQLGLYWRFENTNQERDYNEVFIGNFRIVIQRGIIVRHLLTI